MSRSKSVKRISLLATCVALACLGTASAGAQVLPIAPDTIVVNGKVITANNDDPKKVTVAQAIAIRDGKIIAVGSDKDVRAMAVKGTEVVDVGGHTVLPGLIDGHSHLYETALGFPWAANVDPQLLNIRLRANSLDEAVKVAETAIRARAKQLPPGKWIEVSMGPSNIAHAVFGSRITRKVLDEWAPNHPVTIRTRASLVINSKGIKAFEDYFHQKIPDVYWVKDAELGWSPQYVDFPRSTSIDLIMSTQMDKYADIYKSVLQVNAQNGITTHATHAQSENGYLVALMLDRKNQMPIRWAWSLGWAHIFNANPEDFYSRMPDEAGYGSDYLWNIGMNPVSLDGGAIAMCTTIKAKDDVKARERCTDDQGDVGILRVRALQAAIKKGLNIAGHHVAGDQALDYYQDAIEKSGLSAEKIKTLHLQTDHCHQVRPDQIARAKRLGQTFSCDASEEVAEVIARDYGEEYLANYAPFASMLKAGIQPAISEFGSQSAVRNSPFEYGYIFLTRKSLDGKLKMGVPEEAIPDRMTMLLMMTRWPANSLYRKNLLGSIEVGKFADITVLDKPLMDVPVAELPTIKPIMTMVQGKIVFENSQLRGNTLQFNTQTAKWEKNLKTQSKLWRW
ncbi:MAG TPA: amidohydrolase family protein [Steroidobacteraceae bacterium]|nr:amidohydrolase family protein [Steroidobacteraceae bacterium]